MNVSTAGAEPNSMLMDVASATVMLDSKPKETSVNKLDASVKDVPAATRTNVFIAIMDMTFMRDNASHAKRKIVTIYTPTFHCVKKRVSATIPVSVTATKATNLVMV